MLGPPSLFTSHGLRLHRHRHRRQKLCKAPSCFVVGIRSVINYRRRRPHHGGAIDDEQRLAFGWLKSSVVCFSAASLVPDAGSKLTSAVMCISWIQEAELESIFFSIYSLPSEQ